MIDDNGVGFPDEVLEALADNRPLQESTTSRLGIRNVIRRLRLQYPNEVEVNAANRLEGGASIEIIFPNRIGGDHVQLTGS